MFDKSYELLSSKGSSGQVWRFVTIGTVITLSLTLVISLISASTHHGLTRIEHIRSDYTKVRYVDESPSTEVVILSTVGGLSPFGYENNRPRSMNNYLKMLRQGAGPHKVSLGILCDSKKDFKKLDSYFGRHHGDHLGNVTLIYAPKITRPVYFKDVDLNPAFSSQQIEREWKRSISKAQNFLMYSAMLNEPYVMFVSTDIERFMEPDTIEVFKTSGKSIVVPRIFNTSSGSVDSDSWKGKRKRPSDHLLTMMDENRWREFDFIAGMDGEDMGFDKDAGVVAQGPVNEVIPLDSVGSKVLFIKSVLLKQGLVMSPLNLVGTSWDRNEGYDGLGSSGLCYLGKQMGYSCFGMPNLLVKHS